jgi:hypothetical protein
MGYVTEAKAGELMESVTDDCQRPLILLLIEDGDVLGLLPLESFVFR